MNNSNNNNNADWGLSKPKAKPNRVLSQFSNENSFDSVVCRCRVKIRTGRMRFLGKRLRVFIGPTTDYCVDAVWIVALKAAACFKTRYWALFEAGKVKSRTIGCRIIVATKLEPLAPPLLLS